MTDKYRCYPLQMLSLPAAPHKVGKTILSGFHLHLQTVTELINPRYRHVDRSSSLSYTIIVSARLKLRVILMVMEVGGVAWACVIQSFTLDIKCACLLIMVLFLSLFQVTPELLQPHLLNTAWADSVCFQCFNVYQTDLAQVARIPLLIWCKTLIILLLTRV